MKEGQKRKNHIEKKRNKHEKTGGKKGMERVNEGMGIKKKRLLSEKATGSERKKKFHEKLRSKSRLMRRYVRGDGKQTKVKRDILKRDNREKDSKDETKDRVEREGVRRGSKEVSREKEEGWAL